MVVVVFVFLIVFCIVLNIGKFKCVVLFLFGEMFLINCVL